MGFNLFRSHQRDLADIVVVVVALIVTAGVLVWALLA